MRAARRLYGSALIAANLRGQRRVPFYPRERIEALRDRRVRRIVEHAASAVPYYRDWFSREGVDPREIRTADDLERLPILDRELVRAHPEHFVAETHAAARGLSFLTTGSTGTPLEVRHDRRSLLANIPYGERERDPVIRVCGGGFRPKELYVGYETSTFKKVTAFYGESTLLPRPQRHFVPLQEPIERVAAIANAEQPEVLVGYGGWIDLFFRTIAARGIALRPPKMVMYMGEALPHGARSYIEGELGIPVLSRYNAVEAFKIAFFCEERTGFHIHEDLCHVRVVRNDGQTAVSGEQGHLLISNLVNRASVLLNYPIGDVASMSDATCDCGRTLRLLSELEGRVEDIVTLADGRFVHPRAVWQVFKDDRSVLQYQLTQHEPDRFELTLTTVGDAEFEQAISRARPLLAGLLGEDATIDAERRSELDPRSGGKFRAVVSHCQAQPAGWATTRRR
jgi:phenylacetate-coenzyme A ligase PaaK-like adenylate-forming protein